MEQPLSVASPPQSTTLTGSATQTATYVLAGYLFLLTAAAASILIGIFPHPENDSHATLVFSPVTFGGWVILAEPRPEQGLLLLALLAGILGAFVHASQSLAAYAGNKDFRASWILWYALRPFIGGVLGLTFYFVVRAGLVSASADSVSPYGVVSFGVLAGWFSKQATDKLAEVFDSLFGTRRTQLYGDKLGLAARRPRITGLQPARLDPTAVTATGVVVSVEGEGFDPSTVLAVDGRTASTARDGSGGFKVTILPAMLPKGAQRLRFVVSNPSSAQPGAEPIASEPFDLILGSP